jgi:phosphoserine phosphatase
MAGPPCIDAEKARYVRVHFERQGVDIDYANSYAYADSYSDLGLFGLVGHPVAVYPDRKLAAHAAAQGWEVIGKSSA